MKLDRQLILASSSPRRQKILKENGFEFKAIKPEVNEVFLSSAKDTVLHNATLKAETVFDTNKDSIIVASDTVVSFEDRILGKPNNLEEAFRTLRMLSGKKHEVLTAVSIRSQEIKEDFYDRSSVFFKNLTDSDIDEYFKLCCPLDKAGSYNIDEYGEKIIEKIEGSYENIMGLPIVKLKALLLKLND